MIAFDTGPANMVLDGMMLRSSNGRLTMDRDGRLATKGRVDSRLLAKLLAHPYLSQAPPKSTGRERYGHNVARALLARFADRLRLAYEKKGNLMVKKTTLMRDERDSCATENCRSIAAGERVSLENPVILNVMGRPQVKVRYHGRPCYILADPDTIEVLVQ